MSERNRYIMLIGLLIGCISGIYFFSLLFPAMPFFVTASVAAVAAVLLSIWVLRERRSTDAMPVTNHKKDWIGLLLLAYGILWISFTSPDLANTYGGWDGLAIWNLHARHLVDPLNWQKLFQNEYGHPDYPLCLPAVLAFFLRLTSSPDSLIIPFIFHMLITLCVPVLLYNELWRKNIVAAVLAFALFPIEAFYLSQSMGQYADVLLSFFLLCSVICISYSRENKKYLILSILFMGCCAWTKNEGIILSVALLAIHARMFFSKSNIKYTLLAMAVPLAVVGTFKAICPIANDMVSHSGTNMMTKLTDPTRYSTILNYFIETANKKFPYTRLVIVLYLIICLIRKQLPGKEFLLVITAMCAYFLVYLVTPIDLTWHLHTSGDRLMLQLFPILLYGMGADIARMKWAFSGMFQRNTSENRPVAAAPKPRPRPAPAPAPKGKRR